MTYDGTDADDDGVVEADVDNESTNTEELTNLYDYIIDPDDDIGALLSGSISSGDSIWIGTGEHITTGTYSDGPVIDISADNVTVAGVASSVIQHDGTTTNTGEGSKIVEVHGDGVTFEGFTIDGDKENSGTIDSQDDGHNLAWFGNDATLQGLRSRSSTGDGYEPFGARHSVSNCIFTGNYEQGVHFNGCKDVTISDSILNGSDNNGVVTTYCADGQVTKNVILDGCIIRDTNNEANVVIEPGEGTVRDVTIDGCQIIGGSPYGMLVEDSANSDAIPQDISVNGGLIAESVAIGLYVKYVEGLSVEGTTIKQNGSHGVLAEDADGNVEMEMSDVTIRENNQDDTNKDGVRAIGRGNALDITVQWSRIASSSPSPFHQNGIKITDADGGTSLSGRLHSNKITGVIASRIDAPATIDIARNVNFTTESKGSASVADGGTIAHGLDVPATVGDVQLWTVSSNRAYATGVGSSDITVALEDPSGASVGTAETVYFEADAGT